MARPATHAHGGMPLPSVSNMHAAYLPAMRGARPWAGTHDTCLSNACICLTAAARKGVPKLPGYVLEALVLAEVGG